MRSKTFTTHGIILKRSNVGESDRLVSLLTPEYGKLRCVAKGVRKLTSGKRANLEPGNYVKAFFVETKSMPLLTQATLIADCQPMERNLKNLRQLSQLLEILEKLFVESEVEQRIFDHVLQLRYTLIHEPNSQRVIKAGLSDLIVNLGFQHPNDSKYSTISDYVGALSDKPIRSFHYLQVKG